MWDEGLGFYVKKAPELTAGKAPDQVTAEFVFFSFGVANI